MLKIKDERKKISLKDLDRNSLSLFRYKEAVYYSPLVDEVHTVTGYLVVNLTTSTSLIMDNNTIVEPLTGELTVKEWTQND